MTWILSRTSIIGMILVSEQGGINWYDRMFLPFYRSNWNDGASLPVVSEYSVILTMQVVQLTPYGVNWMHMNIFPVTMLRNDLSIPITRYTDDIMYHARKASFNWTVDGLKQFMSYQLIPSLAPHKNHSNWCWSAQDIHVHTVMPILLNTPKIIPVNACNGQNSKNRSN